MVINNNPALQLVPIVPGEINASRKNQRTQAASLDNETAPNASFTSRVVNESEKQAARQEFESSFDQQNRDNLYREQAGGQSRAIKAYLDNDGTDQKAYLSDVLGIDIRA